MVNAQCVNEKFGKFSEIVQKNGDSTLHRMIWGRLRNQIYENPVETYVVLIARMLSVCVNIKKHTIYICTRKQ
jgi:hypothetical protein